MYIYKESSCLIRRIGVHWESPNIGNTSLQTVYKTYLEVYIKVYDSIIDKDIYVDMERYRCSISTYTSTVQEWLDSMDGKELYTITNFPNAESTYARYENAVLRGYKIELAKAGYHYPPEMPSVDLTDLQLTRPTMPTDLSLLHTHCLLSVNGYYHRSDYDGIATYILDGGVTAMKSRCSHTGILSFTEIGKVTAFQLTDTDIYPLTEGGKLEDGLIIRLPDDHVEKSKLFIFGGYIIQPDPCGFFQNGDNTWVLYPKALPFVERYFESRDEIDLSSIVVETTLTNKENSVVLESLYTDENIRAWLKLSQSFIVYIDTPNLYMGRVNVRVSTLPGLITSYQEPLYPLIMGYGKHTEYSKIMETQWWALRVQDPFYKQYAFQKAPIKVQPVVTNNFIPWQPYKRVQGYMLKLTANKK